MLYNKGRVESDLPIRLVCASRHNLNDFGNTMLGQSFHVHDFEILLEIQNKKSLTQVYNEAIEFSKDKPAILVFVHDDVMITDFFWDKAVRKGLEEFDIVGLAGTTRRNPKQCGWSLLTKDPDIYEESEYLSGVVSHGITFPPQNIGNFGEIGKKCVLMDGLFLAIDSRTLVDNDLRFDERFKFHFYDLDFCRQAEQKALTMGTIPVTVVHGSINKPYGKDWYEMYDEYLKKWKE